MTPDTPNPASAAAQTGSGNAVYRGGERLPNTTPPQKYQGLIRETKRLLRLVPQSPPPRPRRLDVRISVADGRSPIGRAGPFRLTRDELDELIAAAMRLERA